MVFSTFKLIFALLILALPATARALPAVIVRSASGATPPSIQGTVDQFRADLGGPSKGVTPGSQPGGRREISWDGGGAGASFATPIFSRVRITTGHAPLGANNTDGSFDDIGVRDNE